MKKEKSIDIWCQYENVKISHPSHVNRTPDHQNVPQLTNTHINKCIYHEWNAFQKNEKLTKQNSEISTYEACIPIFPWIFTGLSSQPSPPVNQLQLWLFLQCRRCIDEKRRGNAANKRYPLTMSLIQAANPTSHLIMAWREAESASGQCRSMWSLLHLSPVYSLGFVFVYRKPCTPLVRFIHSSSV